MLRVKENSKIWWNILELATVRNLYPQLGLKEDYRTLGRVAGSLAGAVASKRGHPWWPSRDRARGIDTQSSLSFLSSVSCQCLPWAESSQKPEDKEAHWGRRSAFCNTEQRESRSGEANGKYPTISISYNTQNCGLFHTGKRQVWTSNSDTWFQVTSWGWSERTGKSWIKNGCCCSHLIFIRSLLGARFYSEYFILTHCVFRTTPGGVYHD